MSTPSSTPPSSPVSGPLAKGALVEYRPTQPPTPVITTFQYNPESMIHTWTQPPPSGRAGVETNNPLAVPGEPSESFQFTIFLDAYDDLTGTSPMLTAASESGVGARLAALELLLYPGGSKRPAAAKGRLLGTASAASTSGASAASPTWRLPNSTVPVVLFYLNPNRMVPVRVTTLTVTETLYDTRLNPTHAQAQLSLRVLTPTELKAANPADGTPAALAIAAYNKTLDTRRGWAAYPVGDPSGTIAPNLPHP